jgi:hypothetical protein
MAGKQAKPCAPRELKAEGQRLWDAVCADFELEPYEASLLLQAAQTADIIADLQDVIETLGVDCAARELAEVRQQRLTYARLITAMRLPGGLAEDGKPLRTQRRAIRGVYRGSV